MERQVREEMVSNFIEQREPLVIIADKHEHRARKVQVFFNNCVINTIYCADCDVRLNWYITNLDDETSPIGATDSTTLS